MQTTSTTGLTYQALTLAGVRRGMTRHDAQKIADAELVIVLIPGEGEYLTVVPAGYGAGGVSRGSWECAESEYMALGWTVKVAI